MSESGSSGSQGTSPQAMIMNYSQYLPSYLSANTSQIPAYGNAITNTALQGVTGTGGTTARSVSGLSNELNPSLFTANTAASNANNAAIGAMPAINTAVQGASNQLEAINLNGLSPGEYNATERSLNRTNTGTGNLGVLNPSNTISNAMNFGGAFNSKIPLYNTAVNTAANAANTALGASTAFGNASNAASGAANAFTGSNSGMNAIANPAALATTSSLTNSGLLNQVAQGNYGQNSSGSAGVNCCFIFMEAYHGTIPASVRKYRDKYYRLYPSIANGYKKMAKWLVPLIRKHTLIRSIVWSCMIKPATIHTMKPKHNINRLISHSWLKFWSFYGRNYV